MVERNLGCNPDLLFANAMCKYEEGVYANAVSRCTQTTDEVSGQLFLINDLLSAIRKKRQEKPDSDIDISDLHGKITQFRGVWDQFCDQHPEIAHHSENPLPEDMDLTKVSHSSLEFVESGLHNIETRRQSEIQNAMSDLEAATLVNKQLSEIITQICRSVRESKQYYVHNKGQ